MPVWMRAREPVLTQGSYLPNCVVPVFDAEFDPQSLINDDARPVVVEHPKTLVSRLLRKWNYTQRKSERILDSSVHPVQVDVFDLIVMTQSCDLENNKVRKVALCSTVSIDEFEKYNPGFKKKQWSEVKRGRIYGLYALPSLPSTVSSNDEDELIVDFREIFTLSLTNLTRYAATLETRWCLQSPHLEAFSHAFGNFFSRVAIP